MAAPLDDIIAEAHRRGVRVLVDAAQLAPHRPLPQAADFLAFSGHKLYAPFGSGALIGPRAFFETGDPFLAGGGAVDLVGLDEVVWTAPPDREEAGSPNVVGAVALQAAVEAVGRIGWDSVMAHEQELARRMTEGLATIDGVRLLGPLHSSGPHSHHIAAVVTDQVRCADTRRTLHPRHLFFLQVHRDLHCFRATRRCLRCPTPPSPPRRGPGDSACPARR